MNEGRPQYETDDDRTNEWQIANEVSDVTGLIFHKNPISYRADFLVVERDGRPFSWAEIKQRFNTATAFPTYMISYEKFVYVCWWAKVSGTKPLLFVRFSDENKKPIPPIYWVNLAKLKVRPRLVWGGRTKNPRDSQDKEPVAHIHMGEFLTLAEFNQIHQEDYQAPMAMIPMDEFFTLDERIPK